ncbi:MAG: hypothetical protein LBV51_01650 [Acholeplasmatales bacterium]|jgi:hypothetical protein|nr:hypothetical protein [Acholeplasmatales bacterium]
MFKEFVKNYYYLFIILLIAVIVFLPFIILYTTNREIVELGIILSGLFLVISVIPIYLLLGKYFARKKARLNADK